MRGSLLREPRFRLDSSRSSAGALEEDHITEVGFDRLGSGSHDAPEETNGSVWIQTNIRDVSPLEFALIINRVELQAASTSNRRRD